MADSIDARTRAVDKMKADPGKEMAAYQAAENQLLAIQAEQKQNLAMARAQSAATIQQNNTIAQAAEVAAAYVVFVLYLVPAFHPAPVST